MFDLTLPDMLFSAAVLVVIIICVALSDMRRKR